MTSSYIITVHESRNSETLSRDVTAGDAEANSALDPDGVLGVSAAYTNVMISTQNVTKS